MVSLLTALIIQNNEVNLCSYKERESKKWFYEVSRIERGNFRLLFTSIAVYDSRKVALEQGNAFVDEIRKTDFSKQKREIGNLIGDAAEPINKIISACEK